MSESLSFEMAGIAEDGMVIQPDKRIVQFRQGRRHLTLKSQQAGRPIYEPITLFCVRHPGERDETVVEATDFHKMTHPRQWQAFENGRIAEQDGTMLAILFPSEPYIVDHLRGLHIHTVEQLAGLTEAGLQRVGMGARDYQAKAVKFLDDSNRSAPTRELEAKLAAAADQISSLETQVKLLLENAQRQAEAAPRRGRPPRDTGEDA